MKKNVLVIGQGGREHALCQALRRSPSVGDLYCAPGNGGIAQLAQCQPIGVMDFAAQADFALSKGVDLVVVGPDDPLAAGAVDYLESRGFRVFGPSKAAAVLEASKAFAKDLMQKYQIPTAAYASFEEYAQAKEYIRTAAYPLVIKADGLALGKGVAICRNEGEAIEALHSMMVDKKFGASGSRVVIEEFMEGREVSVLAFVDGRNIAVMSSAQDHKRAYDGDEGPNTGGMGTFSPSPFYTPEVDAYCRKHIYQATVDAMAAEGRPFKGVIFFGLMLTAGGPKVLEYNARFGDPETQVVLPRLKNDLAEVMEACIDGRLDQIRLDFGDQAAVCVVLASEGYPGAYQRGFAIRGLEHFAEREDVFCFHAGTKATQEGICTDGGRVLGVTALGPTLEAARRQAYAAAQWVDFDNKYMRRDIAKEFA